MQKQSLEQLDILSWDENFSQEMQNRATEALESGKILYFPSLDFPLSKNELPLLTPDKMNPKAKNISFDLQHDTIGGLACSEEEQKLYKAFIKRYALAARRLMDHLLPYYQSTLKQAKTSYRPVEIFGRKTSYRKDDTRLHVDAFPSNPIQGKRILRVFTNINTAGKPRVWRAGEPFQDVVNTFAPKVSGPFPGLAHLLQFIKITKSLRSSYDHYMLQIHDAMKGDMEYQRSVRQEELQFPPGSTWIVFTDLVSHAAMSGQHVLEQTFYLPRDAGKYPERSPLAILEMYYNKALI